MKEVGVDELRRRLEAGEDLVVLDVREPDEVERAAIPGSVNIPLGEVVDRMGELDAAPPHRGHLRRRSAFRQGGQGADCCRLHR